MSLRRGVTWTIPFALENLSDGTPLTDGGGLVVVRVWKDGVQSTSTNAATHVGSGQWQVILTATETNGRVIGLLVSHPACSTIHLTLVPRRTDDLEFIVTDAVSASEFKIAEVAAGWDVPSTANDFYNGAAVVFNSGALKGLTRVASDYGVVGSNKTLYFSGVANDYDAPFPSAPSVGDLVTIIGRVGT